MTIATLLLKAADLISGMAPTTWCRAEYLLDQADYEKRAVAMITELRAAAQSVGEMPEGLHKAWENGRAVAINCVSGEYLKSGPEDKIFLTALSAKIMAAPSPYESAYRESMTAKEQG